MAASRAGSGSDAPGARGVGFIACLIAMATFCLSAFGVQAASLHLAQAVDPPPASHCLAVAANRPPMARVALGAALSSSEIRISFAGHSTFVLETAAGVTIATDYNGYAGGIIPRVVTMNHAHSSHFTAFPDPDIEHVLRGWDMGEGPAKHFLQVDDVLIRNVTTDIRSGAATMEHDGNSIFIFEAAGLCIGHLGHLHHRLTDEQYAQIGRIDILMVPVDGSFTMGHDGMLEVARRLRSSIILPMHYFGQLSFNRFLSEMGKEMDVEISQEPTRVFSLAGLPQKPKILVLPGF